MPAPPARGSSSRGRRSRDVAGVGAEVVDRAACPALRGRAGCARRLQPQHRPGGHVEVRGGASASPRSRRRSSAGARGSRGRQPGPARARRAPERPTPSATSATQERRRPLPPPGRQVNSSRSRKREIIRTSAGPAASAITKLPAAWATLNGIPAGRQRQVAVERLLAAVGDHHREVEQRAVGEARRPRTRSASPRRPRRRRLAAAERAPAARTMPQPAICQGVQGPWPSQRFETGAASAPTANPGAAAEGVAGDQRDVGRRDDVRDRRQHEPARDRERRERRDQGDHARRGPRALVPDDPADDHQRQEREARRAARSSRRPLSARPSARRSSSAPSAGVIGAPSPEDPGHLGGEVPAPGEDLGRRRRRRSRGRRRAARRGRRSPRRTRRRGSPPARRSPPPASPPSRSASSSLRRRSIPRVGSSRQTSAGASPPVPRPAITIASARRWRSPPERSRGIARRRPSPDPRPRAPPRPRRPAARRPTRSRARKSAGLWDRSAQPPGVAARPRAGVDEPRRRAHERALAGAVSAHQRDPLARLDPQRSRRGAPPGARPRRRARPTGRSRRALRPAGCAPQRMGCRLLFSPPRARRVPGARDLDAPSGKLRPGVLDARRQRLQAGQVKHARPRGGQDRVAGHRPVEERARGAVERRARRRPWQDTRSAAARQRSSRCSARTTAVPHSSFRRRKQPDQLVSRHGVELRGRLVQQHQPRTPHQGRRQRDPLQLAAGEGVGGAVEQVGDRQRQRHLLDRPGPRRRRLAPDLQRQLELAPDGGRRPPGSRDPGRRVRPRRRGRPGRGRRRRGRRPAGGRRPRPRGSGAPGRTGREEAWTCPSPSGRPAR